jgi:uncharacterized protein YjbI with pentapeptide repeats
MRIQSSTSDLRSETSPGSLLGAAVAGVDVPDRASAIAATLAALRAGEVRGAVDLAGAVLVDEDLSGLDLSGADLRGAELSRARLTGARLLRTDLSGATLFEADLSGTELSGADLTGANLQGADLGGAGLGAACLDGASLVEARLTEASLVSASLVGADLRSADLTRARARGADWSRADLSAATLVEVELDHGLMRDTRFDRADLRRAQLRSMVDYKRASWIGVDIREVDFTGAYLARRFIHDQNFLAEYRLQGWFEALVYKLWWLTSDCGRSALRWGACTGALVLAFAWAYTQVGVDWGSHPTDLSPLYMSVVTMTTLGYGDVLPSSAGAQCVAMCQVVTGYVMLGGLLSIFNSKMASRAD